MAAKKTNDVGATAAATQAKQPIPQVAVPSRGSRMTKEKAKELGLDASVYGKIDDKEPAAKKAAE